MTEIVSYIGPYTIVTNADGTRTIWRDVEALPRPTQSIKVVDLPCQDYEGDSDVRIALQFLRHALTARWTDDRIDHVLRALGATEQHCTEKPEPGA